MVKTKKKVDMPAGIRNKLVAAVAMLLVASVLMVSSTYAWFTLSTAPEVTGITTSVGANGNLEIALLTTDTYDNLTSISSAVGDSTVKKGATGSNITWGNLVDLSDTSYGLTGIKLMPAAANLNAETGKLSTASLLKTPVYGPDGRVSELQANTVSAIKAGEAGFAYAAGTPTYGVRAVGIASDITARQLAYNNYKAEAGRAAGSATSGVIVAFNNVDALTLMTTLNKDDSSAISQDEVNVIKTLAGGIQTSLNTIVKAYATYGAAYIVSGGTDLGDEEATAAATTLAAITSASDLQAALAEYSVSSFNTQLGAIADAQTNVADALDYLNGNELLPGTTTFAEVKSSALNQLVGSSTDIKAYNADGETVTLDTANVAAIKKLYLNGGAIKTIADENAAGTFIIKQGFVLQNLDLYGGPNTADESVTQAAKNLTAVNAALTALTAPAGASVSTISDTYGYVIDFAFRTNAADSYLMLQTEAANRVYSDQTGADLATQGSGSNVTFTWTTGMDQDQAAKLLGNLRLVFFDPEEGTVFANARLDGISHGNNKTTADVKLYSSTPTTTITVGKDFYVAGEGGVYVALASITVNDSTVTVTAEDAGLSEGAEISAGAYEDLPALTTVVTTESGAFVVGDNANIVALTQNEGKMVSVLVYLDGETIQNSDVIAEAVSSGTLDLNLQFSSSAELVPMENTALKNMTNAD